MAEPQALLFYQDVPVDLSVELDRRMMKVRDILNLQIGSVVKMNRSAGDNMALRLHDLLVGYGEVVVIEARIGIRITDIRQE